VELPHRLGGRRLDRIRHAEKGDQASLDRQIEHGLSERSECGGAAFSVETACAGFIYALSIADKYVKAGDAKCALVVGAETLSRITNWDDRATAVLFADGAGAVVLRPSTEPGLMSTDLFLACRANGGEASGVERRSVRTDGARDDTPEVPRQT